ncbi:MAG TPA: hypothetical protein VF395_16675, partial [Polyangiaceae bacterium]
PPVGMSKVAKISVSVGEEELQWAQKAARARRTSLSQVVSAALRFERQMEARRRVLEQLPASAPEALAAVDREWDSG